MTINHNAELLFCNWIENNAQHLSINNWRASLVPAAAVIPAPIAYINVVAVKKLVVEVKCESSGFSFEFPAASYSFQIVCMGIHLSVYCIWSFTVRKLECSKHTFV